MKLYLLRHAHSEEGPRMEADRGLTDKGKAQCQALRAFVKDLGVSFDIVLSSPFLRTVETVQGILGRDPDVQLRELEPDATVEQAWRAVMFHVEHSDHVLICSHSPLIHELLASVCFVFNGKHVFSHGSMCHVDTAPPEEDESGFRWFVSPHLVEKLNESMKSQAMADECLRLSEHLMTAARRKIIDPLITSLRQEVVQRFRRQWKAFHANVKASGSLHVAAAVTATRDPKFADEFSKLTGKAYTAGAKNAQSQLPTVKEARPAPLPDLGGPDRTAADLESEIDETTDSQVSDIVSEGLAAGLSIAAILALVQQQFQDWATGGRAEAIAINEISTAYHQGMTDYVQNWVGGNGLVEKAWSAQPDACDECAPNEDDGWIDAEASFSSGDFGPPVHPNCRCSIEYRAVES